MAGNGGCRLGGMSGSDAVSMSFFSHIAINICLAGRVVYSAGRKCNGVVKQWMTWEASFVWLTGRRGGRRGRLVGSLLHVSSNLPSVHLNLQQT